MGRKLLSVSLLGTLFVAVWPLTGYAEKLKFGTPGKTIAVMYLPMLAAEENGFWKRNGLEVEWVPFRASTAVFHSVAGGHIKVALDDAMPLVPAIARGLPAIMVGEYQGTDYFTFFVLAASPIREPAGLKGKRVGVSSIGGASHTKARVMARALGLERDIKFVGVGGIPEGIAALKAEALDASFTSTPAYVNLMVRGEARRLVDPDEVLKEDVTDTVVFASRDFINDAPDTLSKAVRALAQATALLADHPGWGVQRMISYQGFSPKAAEIAFGVHKFKKDLRIDPKGLERLRRILIDFGVIGEREAPPVERLFTNRFIE